jgi:hypothetical protein
MTAKQRSELARKAAKVRWSKGVRPLPKRVRERIYARSNSRWLHGRVEIGRERAFVPTFKGPSHRPRPGRAQMALRCSSPRCG